MIAPPRPLWPWLLLAVVAVALVSGAFRGADDGLSSSVAGSAPGWCGGGCVVVLEGDSLTAGLGDRVCAALTTATCVNSGTSGWRGDQMVEAAPDDVDHLVDDGGSVVTLWTGTNDLGQGRSPSDAYDAVIRYVADRRAAGWDHVAVVTLAPMDLADNEAVLAFDELIRGNTAGADSLIELDRDPRLTGSDRARYFTDGIHHTPEGADLVASIFLDHLAGT